MRVAVIAPNYAPVVGGVETVVTQVARALVRRGCAVDVWTHRRPELATVEVADGVTVHRFASTPSARYPLSPALWRHTQRHAGEYDVVHAHSYHSTAAVGAALHRLPAPLIVTPHYHGVGHTAAARLMHVGYRPLGARLLGNAAAVVAVSAAEEGLLHKDFPAIAARTTVVPNGVDAAALAAAEPWPDAPSTLLVAGRLQPYKRVDRVLSAFDRTTQPGRLVVVGDGPDRARLERLASAARRSADIAFLGRVPDGDLARWLRTARGVVSLSAHEAFGLVGAEGVAAGAVAVLSDIPAHREVASMLGPSATLVDADDVAAVTRALDHAMTTANTGPRATVRSWDDVAADYLALYERVAVSS
ncbi:MAG: glycosyltransferase family 4 protein [Frankiaceae bacterium]|nr:glycosyltransferase family 4 protein [Frankiaceae bacterium]